MPGKNEISLIERDKNEGKSKRKFSAFSIILVFICLLVSGLFVIPLLPVKLNPSRKHPVVNIYFDMRGQSARVVEMEATSKLEAMLGRVKGVQDISSCSSNGSGSITARLSEHVDPDMARFEMSAIIRQTWPSLPPGVGYPSIYMSGTTEGASQPFLRYTINAPLSPVLIQEYVENNIKPKLSEIKGIDRISVTGASRMVYKLEYDFERLQTCKVSVEDIKSAIQACLVKEFFGLGKINDENGEEQWIRIALVSENGDQPFNPSLVQVKNSDGTILMLDQLVKTRFEEEEAASYFRINGLNSIYLSVTAEDAANQLNLSSRVQELMESLESSLPHGYELHLSYDAGEYIKEEMNKIYFRSGLTIFILLCFVFLFYRNLKYSFLIVFSLIANISIAAIFYYLFNLELQLFSLAGLTISLTLIIDNVIIMSDQIIQRGNKKAFLAILTATVTTMGALVIIFFMDESIRLNLLDFAWVIIINLTVSLFIALFLIPALIEKLNIVKKNSGRKKTNRNAAKGRFGRLVLKARDKRLLVLFNRIYEKVILFMYRKKICFIVMIIFAFGLPVFLLPDKVENKTERGYFSTSEDKGSGFLGDIYNSIFGSVFYKETVRPVSDPVLGGTLRLFAQKVKNGSYSSGERSETSLNVAATLPNGSTREQMNTLIERMENYLKQYPEIRQFESGIENGQRASIRILFVKKHQRSQFPYMLKSKLISKALELGGGSWSVYGLGDGFDNDMKEQAGSSRIKILGYSYDDLNALAAAMRDSLLLRRRIKDVTVDSKFSWHKSDYMEFVFNLNRERLARENILPLHLFQSLTPMFEKSVHAASWINKSRIEPIQLFSKQVNELDIWNMENYPGRAGERGYKLTEIASMEKEQVPQDIAKENQQYRLCLQYEYIGSYQQARNVMERTIESFNKTAPLGYKAESDSFGYWWSEGGSGQYWLLLLIVVIIFFTTGILFNSLKQPLVIIFIIPVSFIGVFLTFYLFDLNFDQGGFAAFILLAGISVNANIYVLDEYNNIRAAHPDMKPVKAYIKAWNVKARPIFLTVFSTILGFIPFMTGEYKEAFWFPLAAGTSGGLVLSFIALFIFLPLFMGVGKQQGKLKDKP
ncbi:MAG: efflux RND transporter permease subunit [Prevotella sp.]|jgi:multidrug efflux pump subunit AcrB|nr:efflux RND transporter permease subunit [Prevotella sp.]